MGNPFGVELPENFGSSNADTSAAPEVNQEQEQPVSKDGNNTETTNPSVKELLDLDKLDRFRFQGKEWSLKDLRSAYMMKQDYTRKTQELSETRKYADNFEADLQSVIEDPSLMQKMKAIYPSSYVQLAERILTKLNPQSSSPVSQGQPTQTSPELSKLEQKLAQLEGTLSNYEKERYQAEIQKNEAWLEKTYASLSKKYPHAMEEVVTARAAFLREQGHNINDQVLERIFKDVNKMMQDKYVKEAQTKVSGQLDRNLRGKDTGAGGGIPGAPAVKLKNMKEAEQAALEYFTGRRF